MNGKINWPKSDVPDTYPQSGYYYVWMNLDGFLKKMDENGVVTNLSAQSVNDLNDVDLTGLQNGQGLAWDAAAQLWQPITFPSGGGGNGDVSSVFGRIGAVIAQSGDYNSDQITEGSVNKFISDVELNQIDNNTLGVAANASSISQQIVDIDNNESAIATNASFINQHNVDIAGNATDIATNESAIATNTSDIATKEPAIASASITEYYRGDKTFQTLDKDAVGLGSVDNTADINKPLSNAASVALSQKEDDLGNPSQSGYILSSNTAGDRTWVPAPSGGGGGAVDSWNGRTGIVSPQNNDYNADQIDTTGTVNQFINSSDLAQISTNQGNIATNSGNIATNTGAIGTNANNINTKEDALGNPSTNGYVLSSTAAGARSWVELSGSSNAPIDSVFGRTGDVTAQSGDYNADQIDDSSTTNKFATQAELNEISANTAKWTADPIKLGQGAGATSQGTESTAIGLNAGSDTQGTGCLAIGTNAGQSNQGAKSICFGKGAVRTEDR